MLDTLNKLTSIILKAIVIGAIVVAVGWLGISVVGNISLAKGKTEPVPSVNKAAYEITLTTTGQRLYVNKYDVIDNGVYRVNGYYALKDGKYRWQKAELVLDKAYWGDIEITRR